METISTTYNNPVCFEFFDLLGALILTVMLTFLLVNIKYK